MIKLEINNTKLSASNLEPIVGGNIKSIFIKYVFSSEWNDLARIAVFRNGGTAISLLLKSEICAIPWEVLSSPGELFVSLRGFETNGNLMLCTEDTYLGKIIRGKSSSEIPIAVDITPSIIDTIIANVS